MFSTPGGLKEFTLDSALLRMVLMCQMWSSGAQLTPAPRWRGRMEGEDQVRPAAWTPNLVLPLAFHMTLGKALKQLEPHFLGYKWEPKGA